MSDQFTQSRENEESMNSIVEFLKDQQIEYDETAFGSEVIENYQKFVKQNQNQNFHWKKLSDCFEHIFLLYTEEVGIIRNKIDKNSEVCTVTEFTPWLIYSNSY